MMKVEVEAQLSSLSRVPTSLAGFLADETLDITGYPAFAFANSPPPGFTVTHNSISTSTNSTNPQSWHTKAESARASAAEVSPPTPLPIKIAESVCANSPSRQSTWTKTLTCKQPSPFYPPSIFSHPAHPPIPQTNTRLQLQESCRILRMPSLSHRPPKRRLLPRPHPRPQASNQSRSSRRA